MMKNDVRLDTLADRADLVHFEEKTIARLFLHGSLDTNWVGDRKIITDDLNQVSQGEK
jgi:hypothetical protein